VLTERQHDFRALNWDEVGAVNPIAGIRFLATPIAFLVEDSIASDELFGISVYRCTHGASPTPVPAGVLKVPLAQFKLTNTGTMPPIPIRPMHNFKMLDVLEPGESVLLDLSF
jgi:uncharacterized protein (DUF111 family)